MEYWIQWSSFRDQARKTAREKMQKKGTSDPSTSSAPAPLTEALKQLCQQQFGAHLQLLNLSASGKPLLQSNCAFAFVYFFSQGIKMVSVLPSEHSDPATFFGGKQAHVDHLTEPVSLSSVLRWKYLATHVGH
jgi:hypothetical protein